jgi:hypothetical protein
MKLGDETPQETLGRASSGCALGVIEQLITADGSIVQTPAFTEKVKRRKVVRGGVAANGADANGAGANGADANGTGAIRAAATESGSDDGPTIERLRVRWWGDPQGEGSGLTTCKLTGAIRALEVWDEVPIRAVFYEEPEPGKIRIRMNGLLYAPSLKAITNAAPQSVMDSLGAKSSAGTQADAAASGHTNHAGFYIENQPPQPREVAMWAATLREVEGFTWKAASTVVDCEPPSYKVVDIRRWNGALWAVVHTSDGDVQEDHLLNDIRAMVFDAKVQKLSRERGFGGKTPLMLSWDKLRDPSMSLSYDLLGANLNHYLATMTMQGSR